MKDIETVDRDMLHRVGGAQSRARMISSVKDRLVQIWGQQGHIAFTGKQQFHSEGGVVTGSGLFTVNSMNGGFPKAFPWATNEVRSWVGTIADDVVSKIRTSHAWFRS